jgi:hypothetical protein
MAKFRWQKLIGGWQESIANLALADVVEATVGQRRVLLATREA